MSLKDLRFYHRFYAWVKKNRPDIVQEYKQSMKKKYRTFLEELEQ